MSENNIITVDFGDKSCEIMPFDSPIAPAMMVGYEKMPVSLSQQSQISALCGQLPDFGEAYALKDVYRVKYPQGVPHNLVSFKGTNEYMTAIKGPDEKFIAQAHLVPMAPQAAILAGFTTMSVISGQYFLAEINQKMSMMSKSIDKILEFLYGDKKAELLSEISFVKYASQNFSSIMDYPEQRIATISSLQEARKTAIKDIEFYLADLYTTVHEKNIDNIDATVDKAFQIRQCLELSMQLYMTANLLEVYYSQNYDTAHLRYVESDMSSYISKSDKQVLSDLTALQMAVTGFKPKLGGVGIPAMGKKFNPQPLLERINSAIDYLANTEDNEMKKKLHAGLYSAEKPIEYCICGNGEVYLKKA